MARTRTEPAASRRPGTKRRRSTSDAAKVPRRRKASEKKTDSRRKRPAKAGGRSGNVSSPGMAKAGGDLLWVVLLTLLAWIHRAFFLVSNGDKSLPASWFYEGDARTFFLHARALLAGQEYDGGIPFHPPGFPHVLSWIHTLLGAGGEGATVPHFRVRLVLALLSAVAVGLLFALVRPYLGRVAALLAALLCLYHFGLYVFSVATVSEGVYLSLLLGTLLVWSRNLSHPLSAPGALFRSPRLWGVACGFLCGWLALIRAESLLLAVALWGVGVAGCFMARKTAEEGAARDFPSFRELAPWALFLVGLGVSLLPSTLHNARSLRAVNERFAGQVEEPLPTLVPITLYGPLNLALANHRGADGTFSRDLMSSERESGTLQLTNPQHLEFLLHGDAMAWEFIREEPGAWGRLVLRKWRLMLDAGRLGWTQWNWPGGLNGLRRPIDVFVPYSRAGLGLFVGLCGLGLVLCLAQPGQARRWALVVLLVTGCTLVVTAFFFGYARQGLLIVPLWLSLAAGGLVGLARRFEASRWGSGLPRRRFRWAVALVLGLFLLEAWGATLDRRYRATGTTLSGRSSLNPDLTVYIRPLSPTTP